MVMLRLELKILKVFFQPEQFYDSMIYIYNLINFFFLAASLAYSNTANFTVDLISAPSISQPQCLGYIRRERGGKKTASKIKAAI